MKGIYPNGSGWRVKVTVAGQKIDRTFSQRDEAEKYAAECRQKKPDPEPVPPIAPASFLRQAPGLTIGQLYRRVDDKRWTGNPAHKSARYADGKTARKASTGNALRYVEWCGDTMPAAEALSDVTVTRFLREYDAKVSGNTVNHYSAAISALAKEAVHLGIIARKPEMHKRAVGAGRMRWFTDEEVRAIIETCQAWKFDRHAALFTFLVIMGCRPIEAYRLKWASFKGQMCDLDGTITKNTTPRCLRMPEAASAAVEAMGELSERNQGPFTWAHPGLPATRDLWGKLREHLSWLGDDAVVYTFRHTCATRLVQNGVEIPRVQIWMGHKCINQTLRYAKYAPAHMAECSSIMNDLLPIDARRYGR